MEKGPRRREKNVMKGKEEEKNIKNKRVEFLSLVTLDQPITDEGH